MMMRSEIILKKDGNLQKMEIDNKVIVDISGEKHDEKKYFYKPSNMQKC